MRLVLWCVLLKEILGCVLVWLVLVRQFGRERKIREIVNVSAFTCYRGPNECIRRAGFVDSRDAY